MTRQTRLTLIIRLLEECLEQDYSLEEIRSKIRDILRLLGNYPATETRNTEREKKRPTQAFF